MPGVEDWIEKPMTLIQKVVERLPPGTCKITKVKEYFSKKLQSEEALAWVPSINSCRLHQLTDSSLVRYRCMVQDMFGPELYLAQYSVKNLSSGAVTFRFGHYQDIAACDPEEEIQPNAPENITRERATLYCVPIPGETTWVKTHYASQCRATVHSSSSSSPCRNKRARGEEEDEACDEAMDEESSENRHNRRGDIKLRKTSQPSGNQSSDSNNGAQLTKLPDLNFPLPSESGQACLVKVYGEDEILKVNDMLEIIGILSIDPSIADNTNDSTDDDTMPECMNASEKAAHAPPPSLVPRVHAVLVRKLSHNNPLLPPDLLPSNPVIARLQAGCELLRSQLLSLLEHTLCGDGLAAEYLLCHLVSGIYARADVMPLGKLSLNLSGSLAKAGLAEGLNRLITSLKTQSHQLPLSLNKMNTLRLAPHKDYDANRLISGQLQLGGGTHLILDEVAMESGTLEATGVQNVRSLSDVIQWQKVSYDFKYHTQDFSVDIAVLLVSEGQSFLPKDVHVPLQPLHQPEDLDCHVQSLISQISDDVISQMRAFITVCQKMEYSMDDGVQQALQEEFVRVRRDNPAAMSVNDFHRLLSLVRLLTLSHCTGQCTSEILQRALHMERERCARSQAQQPS